MNNSSKLNFIDYKSLCNVIAIFGGMFAVVSALAPDTIAQLFNISRSGSSNANWVNQDRTVWITLGSLSLLASWARFVVEVYAQKIFMKFFSVFFGAFERNKKTGALSPATWLVDQLHLLQSSILICTFFTRRSISLTA